MLRHPAIRSVRRQTLCNALIIVMGIGGALSNARAQDEVNGKSFNVPAQPAASALNTFAEQADITLVFSQDLVEGVTTRPLAGSFTTVDGLQTMLEGTTLVVQRINATTISVGAGTPPNESDRRAAEDSEASRTLDTITVTGTRIRGGITPSPVIMVGSERIREEGFTNLGEMIRSIPQNSSGGQNPEVPGGNMLQAGFANQNITGGSSLNLRGLGPDATLTLLNGRRLSYGGFSQAVDISAIPVDAVERIEIVPDGASAIYGSDAVGGVGNVILKRDHDGATIGMRYGGATDGGLTTRDYNVTAGTTWSRGGLIAAYKDLSVDPIYASDRDYTAYLDDPARPRTLYSGSDLRSGLISIHQSLGDQVELRLDALRSKRAQESSFFVSDRPEYSYLAPETTSTWASPSIEVLLPKDWTLTVGGAWSKNEHIANQSIVLVETGTSTQVAYSCYCNELLTYEFGAEGPLFAMPGGDARLAAGAGYRKNEFVWTNKLTSSNTVEGDETAKFAYVEVSLPLVGPHQNISGVQRLAVTAAVRGEDYDSFGSVTTPKFGLIYNPGTDVTFKASWGESFKAPTLYQKYAQTFAQLADIAIFGVTGYPPDAVVLIAGGGSPDLYPERARAWTTSLAFHPEALSGLEAELTWFDIDYTDRVVQPVPNVTHSLSNPIYAEFVDTSPTAEEISSVVDNASILYSFDNPAYDLSNVAAIVYYGYANVARQRIKGLDVSGSYRFDLDAGRLTIRGSVSWLDSSQQTSSGQEPFDLAGTLYNPAEVNGRFGAIWNQGSFSASAFANYTGGVTDTVRSEKSASFTTFDVTLRYATAGNRDIWSGLEFALSARNLFDRSPPFSTPTSLIYSLPYDPTNYSAIGRFVSLSVSKHF